MDYELFKSSLSFIEQLEKDDHILVVDSLPAEQGRGSNIGIVLDSELSDLCNTDYLRCMSQGAQLCGSLETFITLRQHSRRFAAQHNPDSLLLTICQAARLVIEYRQTIAAGNAEYLRNDNDNDDDDTRSTKALPLGEAGLGASSPLFITMMSIDNTPQIIGYELAGEITLEKYEAKDNAIMRSKSA